MERGRGWDRRNLEGALQDVPSDRDFRQHHSNSTPVMIWLNLNSEEEADELYEIWKEKNNTTVKNRWVLTADKLLGTEYHFQRIGKLMVNQAG
jgi:hypothetical protein